MATGAEGTQCGPVRVLVVDDDPGVVGMVLYALRGRGFEASGVGDGLQALARLQREEFDAIVTDFQMPRLDGLALLREVRRMAHPPAVVVHSSRVDAATDALFRRAGAFRVLVKGGPLGDLLRSVQEACAAFRRTSACCA